MTILTPEDKAALDRMRKFVAHIDENEDSYNYQGGTRQMREDDGRIVRLALRENPFDENRSTSRSLPNAVMQTTTTNCFRACVATVLRLGIDEVPTACDGATWDWDAFQDWLAKRGLQAIEIGFGNGGTIYPVRQPVRCILSGKSPRECPSGRHGVVGLLLGLEGFELEHDPHQSGDWIDGDPTHATFFVSIRDDEPDMKAIHRSLCEVERGEYRPIEDVVESLRAGTEQINEASRNLSDVFDRRHVPVECSHRYEYFSGTNSYFLCVYCGHRENVKCE